MNAKIMMNVSVAIKQPSEASIVCGDVAVFGFREEAKERMDTEAQGFCISLWLLCSALLCDSACFFL